MNGPTTGSGRCAGGAAISQKPCCAIWVAFGVARGSAGVAVGASVGTKVGRGVATRVGGTGVGGTVGVLSAPLGSSVANAAGVESLLREPTRVTADGAAVGTGTSGAAATWQPASRPTHAIRLTRRHAIPGLIVPDLYRPRTQNVSPPVAQTC